MHFNGLVEQSLNFWYTSFTLSFLMLFYLLISNGVIKTLTGISALGIIGSFIFLKVLLLKSTSAISCLLSAY